MMTEPEYDLHQLKQQLLQLNDQIEKAYMATTLLSKMIPQYKEAILAIRDEYLTTTAESK